MPKEKRMKRSNSDEESDGETEHDAVTQRNRDADSSADDTSNDAGNTRTRTMASSASAADSSSANQSGNTSVSQRIGRLNLSSTQLSNLQSQQVSANGTGVLADYPKGSIIKMIFNDFLTYRYVVVSPGSRLNVLLGPNGTGKSSVICGICLTLGGTPKSLGRSEKIADYIRHGATEGSVEIHLCDDSKPSGYTSVKAKFKKNTTEFEVDGQHSTQGNVRHIAKLYNIQVDNPVAFLAQDKVKSFSEQSPIELLKNTEKAGSPDLLKLHEELIEKKKEEASFDTAKLASDKTLASLENNNRLLLGQIVNLRPKVEAYHQHIRRADKIKLLEQKKAMLEFTEMIEDYERQQEKVSELKESLKEKERRLNQGSLRAVQIATDVSALYKKISDTKTNYKQHFDASKFNSDMHKRELTEAKNNYTRVMNQARDYDANIERQRRVIEKIEKELEKETKTFANMHYSESDFRAKRTAFDKKDEEHRVKETELRERIRKCQNDKTAINDSIYHHQQRVKDRVSKCLYGHAAQAYAWYEGHRNEFDHPVYIPALHLETSSERMSRYIEHMVSNDDLQMFVCGSREDERRLFAGTRGLRINTTVVRKEDITNRIDNVISPDLRQFGFESLLHELIGGPNPIRQYLLNVCATDQILVATQPIARLDDVIDRIRKTPYKRLIVHDLRVSITVSRYNPSSFSMQQSQLRSTLRMLHFAHEKQADFSKEYDRMKKLQEEETRSKKEFDQLSITRRELQTQRDKAYEENQKWKSQQNKIKELEGRLEVMHKTLQRLSDAETRPTAESAAEELKTAKEQIFRKLVERLRSATRNMETARNMAVKIELYNMQVVNMDALRIEADKEKVAKEGELYDDRSRLVEEESELKSKGKLKDSKTRTLYNTCRINDSRTAKLLSQSEQQKYLDLINAFTEKNIPNTVDEVKKQLQTEIARQNIAGSTDKGTAQDVEKLKQLEEEKAALEDGQIRQREQRDKWSENMMREVRAWRDPIERIVSTINENYVKFFRELGCIGEVHLDVPENEMDIGSYGILIMVSFRSGERLKRLDNKVQSGGERSVSTMLYLLALQELCPVPFRCVDEINQGMDPTNERKVFDIMVNKLSSNVGHLGKSQYFLLTPKLLKGLKFNDKCTALVVENGAKLHEKITDTSPNEIMARLEAVYGSKANPVATPQRRIISTGGGA